MAILLVLVHQFDVVARGPGASFAEMIARHALAFGWVGVQLFFVLSGFLITEILLEARGKKAYYLAFYIRRVLRIFPLYYGALIAFLLLLPALGIVPTSWREGQLSLWVFLSNWIPAVAMPHFWSLAVEEQFYLVWPFVVARLSDRRLFNTCIALAMLSLFLRVLMRMSDVPPEMIYSNSLSRMDALVLGGAAAVVFRLPPGSMPLPQSPRSLWILAWAVGLVGLVTTHFYSVKSAAGQTVGYGALSIAFALAILALARSDLSRAPADPHKGLLRARALRAVGTYSFGMYVFHKPLHDLVGKRILRSMQFGEELPLGQGLAYIATAMLVTFVAGLLSYHLYESHFLGLKDRLAPRPS